MAQNYFQFKQFRIQQDRCAQKVSTDACLFGALIASESQGRVLEVGSGTGLLSIMLAQKNKQKITGIEIQEECYQQSLQNLKSVQFRADINFQHADINSWQSEERFDFIFSNSPFFENIYPSKDPVRQQARHAHSLILQDWCDIIDRLAEPGLRCALLLAVNPLRDRYEEVMTSVGLSKYKEIWIHDRMGVSAHRCVAFWAEPAETLNQEKIYIKKSDGAHTAEYISLMKDYYLYL